MRVEHHPSAANEAKKRERNPPPKKIEKTDRKKHGRAEHHQGSIPLERVRPLRGINGLRTSGGGRDVLIIADHLRLPLAVLDCPRISYV